LLLSLGVMIAALMLLGRLEHTPSDR